MSEQESLELPEVLKKLEIFPVTLASLKIVDEDVPLNPFYCRDLASGKNDEKIREIFGDRCGCSCRVSSIEHRIIKQASFKQKSSGGKLLKEPILKSIQNCVHHRHTRHKRRGESRQRHFNDLVDCPNLDALRLEEEAEPINVTKRVDTLNDFRKLAEEIDIVTSNESSSNKEVTFRQQHLTTMQSDSRLKHQKRLKKGQAAKGTPLEQNNNSTSGASSSCAQQARITAPSTCDVTIDELASYFETFVHIPKKMSTMAEMMYI